MLLKIHRARIHAGTFCTGVIFSFLFLLKISDHIRNMGYLKYKYIHILNIVYEYVLIYPRLKTMYEIQKNP